MFYYILDERVYLAVDEGIELVDIGMVVGDVFVDRLSPRGEESAMPLAGNLPPRVDGADGDF